MSINQKYLEAVRQLDEDFWDYRVHWDSDEFRNRRDSLLLGIQGRVSNPEARHITLRFPEAMEQDHWESWIIEVDGIPVGSCGPDLSEPLEWHVNIDAIIRDGGSETPVTSGYGVENPREAVNFVVDRLKKLFEEMRHG